MDLTGKLYLINIDASLKDIPLPSAREYKRDLILKTTEFIRRIRWRAYFADHTMDRNFKINHGIVDNEIS